MPIGHSREIFGPDTSLAAISSHTMWCHSNAVDFSHTFPKTAHNSPVRVCYEMLFVDLALDWYYASVLVIIYVISYNIGPGYNGTPLYFLLELITQSLCFAAGAGNCTDPLIDFPRAIYSARVLNNKCIVWRPYEAIKYASTDWKHSFHNSPSLLADNFCNWYSFSFLKYFNLSKAICIIGLA